MQPKQDSQINTALRPLPDQCREAITQALLYHPADVPLMSVVLTNLTFSAVKVDALADKRREKKLSRRCRI